VREIAPVFLKNPGRIEALFTLNFLSLLLQGVTSRKGPLRASPHRTKAAPGDETRASELPIYPGQRQCKRPTTEQILRLFSLAERHTLTRAARTVQVFHT
jgi:hypothetical protein